MNVFIKLPNGKKVSHGQTRMGEFIRTIQSNAIRFSDKSFCLNSQAIPILQKHKIQYLKFIWVKADEKVIYKISFAKALQVGKFITNEYGEENLRIPIVECKIHQRWSNPEIQDHLKKIEEREQTIEQYKLF